MSAYLYAVAPLEYTTVLTLNSADCKETNYQCYLEDELADYFQFDSTEISERNVPFYNDNSVYYQQFISFRMRDHFLDELKHMLPIFWDMLKLAGFCNADKLEEFIENEYGALSFDYDKLSVIDAALASISSNYYLRLWKGLAKQMVYCGWPFAEKDRCYSTFAAFTIGNSKQKYGLDTDGESRFQDSVNTIKQNLIADYPIADIMRVMAF